MGQEGGKEQDRLSLERNDRGDLVAMFRIIMEEGGRAECLTLG